jgi:DNA polymerase-3 subunit delta'
VIVGHQKQLEFLKKSAEAGKISHAYLFSGPNKVGKKKAAFEWLSALFMTEMSESRVHPDFAFVRAGEDSKNIKIEQIRDLIWKLSLTPSSAPLKAAIIDDAHLMNGDSQNCLLKTLEEPSGRTLLILIAENPRLLLPTVVSRCETMKFGFVPQGETSRYLKDNLFSARAGEEAMEEIMRLSFGRPGQAIDFVLRPEELDKWRSEMKDLALILSGDLASRFKYAKKISEEKKLGEILEIWIFYFRNLMLAALKGNNTLSVSKETSVPDPHFVFSKTKNAAYPLAKIASAIRKIQQLNYLVSTTNVNEKLALENLMIEI